MDTAPGPSSFYRADIWRLGVRLSPLLASRAGRWFCRAVADVYCCFATHRRDVVRRNLLPVLAGDGPQARRLSREVFRQLARKLTDLWLFERGRSLDALFAGFHGWERLVAAQARGRGALLVTVHLGNWELGGPMLTRQGVKLQVLTQAEPGDNFTKLRQVSRERWGIETRVVGNNWYDFIEIIKQLEGGAAVAMLLDRPQPGSAVTVQLFGRDFPASIAAAELARASGCALLPVLVLNTHRGYEAHVLPEITYHRRDLGDRARRISVTQEILLAFEPFIREYPDQWFHFVPVWPEEAAEGAGVRPGTAECELR